LTATEGFAIANAGASDDVVTKALVAEIERFYPRIASSLRFSRLQRAEASVPHFHVGAYRALDRFQRVQVDQRARGRRLYFAGDHLAGPSAENAAASGGRAARALLEDVGPIRRAEGLR
jgi:predicted NAD/FAD-dependent oxidoreductase